MNLKNLQQTQSIDAQYYRDLSKEVGVRGSKIKYKLIR